jgi:hypothetical protein
VDKENTIMGFADLKKNRANRFDNLIKKVETQEQSTSYESGSDFWKATPDKKTNRGTAVIRFLPEPAGEDMPYVKFFNHFFKGPKGTYVENSLTTLGKDDPVSEYNSELWNSGSDANKKIARDQKRKLHYVANIYIVEDHGDPSNNGTVRQFRFGKKIWDKINTAMSPEFPGQQAINPFDLWDGANFNLIMLRKGEFWNYDDSTFATSSPLAKDDKTLKAIYDEAQSLQKFISPENFKTYDELKTRLYKVLGMQSGDSFKIPTPSVVEAVAAENETVSLDIESVSSEVIDISPDTDDDLKIFEDLVRESGK